AAMRSTAAVRGMAKVSTMAAWRVRPGADGADVYVHKVAGGIVANPAFVQRERGLANLRGGRAGDLDIDRVAQDVLRVFRHAAAAGPQPFIGHLGAIPANDVD